RWGRPSHCSRTTSRCSPRPCTRGWSPGAGRGDISLGYTPGESEREVDRGVCGMKRLGLEHEVVDHDVYDRSVGRFREQATALPPFAQLAVPTQIPEPTLTALKGVDPDEPHPLNLFRVHWYNGPGREDRVPVPEHVVLPQELTGVPAPIVVALGDRF